MPINTPPVVQPHTDLAISSLADSAPNILYWLGQAGSLGAPYGSLTTRSTNTTAVAIAATETLIGSVPVIAGTTLGAGSRIRFSVNGTYTSAGAQTVTFTLRAGTAGTTADASVGTLWTGTTPASGTAIFFSLNGAVTIRTTGTSGTCVGEATLTNGGTTGIAAAVATAVQNLGSSTINTTASTFIDLTMTAGTGNSASITDFLLEVIP